MCSSMLNIGEKINFTSIVDRDHFKFNHLLFLSVVVERVQRRWYVSCSFDPCWDDMVGWGSTIWMSKCVSYFLDPSWYV